MAIPGKGHHRSTTGHHQMGEILHPTATETPLEGYT